ncbi:MAG: immunoglobulin-like domain-containing protein [Patescibacteria group bacterium]
MRRISVSNTSFLVAIKFLSLITILFVVVLFSLFLSPEKASAATLTVVTATTTSSNASSTLAKIGDTVQFGLQLSGTPVATSTPVINIFNMGTTSMTGSGAFWAYSTTTSASWSEGALQFKIGHGDSAPGVGATTTRTQTSLTGPNVTFDSIAPTLTIVSIASNNSSTTLAKAGDTITVTATSSENIRIPTITIDGQSATFSLITGSTTWKGTYTIIQGDTEGTAPFSITYTDSASNGGSDSPKTAVTTGPNVIVDTTAPTISLTGSASDSVYASTQGYADSGATVSDSREGAINSALVTSGSVNRSIVGTHTLTYNANDSAGNAAVAVTRTITVNHISAGGIFTGNVSSLPNYKAPRPQIIHPDGRVVYLDENGATSPAIISTTHTYKRTLTAGSTGDDVVALQTFFENKGFLIMPQGVAKGYFGSLTKRALMKYQGSIGLEAAGIVGPKTRATLNNEN